MQVESGSRNAVQYLWLQYLLKVTLPGGDRSCMPPEVFSIRNLPTYKNVQHPSCFCTASLILYVWCWIISTKNYHYDAPMLLDGRINKIPVKFMGRDSSVGIATRYGLEVRGSNPGGSEIFRIRPDRPWCPPRMGTGSFPGVKRTGRGVDHSPPSSAEVKERVELYLHSSGPL